MSNKLKVGDVVTRKDGQWLRSGGEAYRTAVVISLNPFAIASVDGDMLWQNTVERDEFRAICQAPKPCMKFAMSRLPEVHADENFTTGNPTEQEVDHIHHLMDGVYVTHAKHLTPPGEPVEVGRTEFTIRVPMQGPLYALLMEAFKRN